MAYVHISLKNELTKYTVYKHNWVIPKKRIADSTSIAHWYEYQATIADANDGRALQAGPAWFGHQQVEESTKNRDFGNQLSKVL